MKNQLIQEFLAQYDKLSTDPEQGPDPSRQELVQVEDGLTGVVDGLDLPEIDAEQRPELWGKRAPDLAALMIETADGLRECPQILALLDTDPEAFPFAAEQDLAVGGVIRALVTMNNASDTGVLVCGAQATRLLDGVEAEVRAMLKDPQVPELLKQTLSEQMADPMARRVQAEQRAQNLIDARQEALAADKAAVQESLSEDDLSALVRQLVSDALGEQPAQGQADTKAAKPAKSTTGKKGKGQGKGKKGQPAAGPQAAPHS